MGTDGFVVAPWIKQAHRLYLGSLIAWGVGFALAIVAQVAVSIQFDGGPGIQFLYSGFMLAALPGLLYFYLSSRKMLRTDEAQAQATFARVMIVQHITGVIAMVGAVLGFVPFLVNFVGFFSLPFMFAGDPEMQMASPWSMLAQNAGMFIPWISLYGFVVTYIAALVIDRRRKRA